MLNMTAHGNLGRDPELKEVGSTQVASFSIAARTGKDETTWIDCSVWGKRADTVINYLQGRPHHRRRLSQSADL